MLLLLLGLIVISFDNVAVVLGDLLELLRNANVSVLDSDVVAKKIRIREILVDCIMVWRTREHTAVGCFRIGT